VANPKNKTEWENKRITMCGTPQGLTNPLSEAEKNQFAGMNVPDKIVFLSN
jgi:hypothetical protein